MTTAAYKAIRFERKGAIAVVTLNRPEAENAIDSTTARELVEVAERIDDDDAVRVVVIRAEGEAFSVGLDIRELLQTVSPQEGHVALEIARRIGEADPWTRLAGLSKPTIAATRGPALGAGLELALACDIRLAAEEASFGFPEVRLGIIPSQGGTQRLPRLIGRGKAIEMILTGETIDAAEAHRIELVAEVVPGKDLDRTAEGLASSLASYGPIALRFAREAVSRGLEMTFDQGLHLESDLYSLLQTTEDRAEGIRSFLEKRPPKFTGR